MAVDAVPVDELPLLLRFSRGALVRTQPLATDQGADGRYRYQRLTSSRDAVRGVDSLPLHAATLVAVRFTIYASGVR
jgi:hypothetical protein